MLAVRDLSIRYGDSTAVSGVSLDVEPGEVVALLGPNGAGKSSIGQAIAGLTRSTGEIELEGVSITKASAEDRVRAGIVYVPEGRRVFPQLTVAENLRAGAFTKRRTAPWHERIESIYERLPQLRARADVKAALLSGGEQQLLAIARALLTFPRLVLLDEPSLGLSPAAIGIVSGFLKELARDDDLTLVVLEQNLAFTTTLVDRGWLIDLGRVVRTVTRTELTESDGGRTLFQARA